jgi:hypothetical protein
VLKSCCPHIQTLPWLTINGNAAPDPSISETLAAVSHNPPLPLPYTHSDSTEQLVSLLQTWPSLDDVCLTYFNDNTQGFKNDLERLQLLHSAPGE